MSCDVIETMLYCIQTIYCKGSSETAHNVQARLSLNCELTNDVNVHV